MPADHSFLLSNFFSIDESESAETKTLATAIQKIQLMVMNQHTLFNRSGRRVKNAEGHRVYKRR
jgi:hypothetical protein